MNKRNLKLNLYLVMVLAFLMYPIYMSAAKKPSKKQLALWEQIEKSAEQNNAEETIWLCKSLISSTESFDSLAILSRSLLAEYYLTTEDLYSVYDSYVFFREYSKIPDHQESAEYYCNKLSEYYQQLLNKELQSENYEGVWFSDMQGEANQPYIAFVLKVDALGEPNIKLWEGCQFYKEFSKFKDNQGRSVDNSSPVLENTSKIEDGNHRYIAQWGDQRIKESKDNAVLSLQGMSNSVHTETTRAVASAPSGHFGEVLAVQSASSLLSALFEAGADMLSTSSVKSYSATLTLGDINVGEMPASLLIDTDKTITGQDPISSNKEIKFNLYKWYPHEEITFMSDNYSSLANIIHRSPNKVEMKYYGTTSPFSYKSGNKNGRRMAIMTGKKKFNDQMYIDFARERIFWQMYSDTTKTLVPLPENMKYYSYSGNTILTGWDAKNNQEENYKAERKADGTISYYQMVGSNLNGLRSGYYPNGEHHVCKVYDGVKQGKYLTYNSEGDLLGYNYYADGKKEGKSRWRVDNGWLEQQWSEDSIAGLPKIIYDNGDVYEGEIKEGKPNGKGTKKLATGEIQTGDWQDGYYVIPIVIPEKKTPTRRRRR